ncbi:hypothetical protein P4S72_19025 [Vibrio sp. PP-XX7]
MNNVIYGWGNRSGEAIDGSKGGYVHMNYVGNYAIANRDSRNAASLWDEKKTEGILTYQHDNKLDNNYNGILDGSNKGWDLFPNFISSQKRSERWAFPTVPTVSADEAYQIVLAQVGASLTRDTIDNRIIQQVKDNTGSIIDSQDDVGGLSTLNSGVANPDNDQDGMPDAWESAHQLNPNDAADGKTKSLNGTYTNLEVYLNSLVS